MKQANVHNQKRIARLEGEIHYYCATDNLSGMNEIALRALEKTYLPKSLNLKLHAKVMLLQNLNVSEEWVNGRLALIESLHDDHIVMQALDNPEQRISITPIERTIPYTSYSRIQYPINLAWAFTVHKVQYLTLDNIAVDVRNFFAEGQLYVALSRVRKLENLYIINWKQTKNVRKFVYNPSTVEFLKAHIRERQT